MAQVGRGNAVADAFGVVKLSGFPGSVLWAILHAWYVRIKLRKLLDVDAMIEYKRFWAVGRSVGIR